VATLIGDVLAARAIILALVTLRHAQQTAEQARRDLREDRRIDLLQSVIVDIAVAFEEWVVLFAPSESGWSPKSTSESSQLFMTFAVGGGWGPRQAAGAAPAGRLGPEPEDGRRSPGGHPPTERWQVPPPMSPLLLGSDQAASRRWVPASRGWARSAGFRGIGEARLFGRRVDADACTRRCWVDRGSGCPAAGEREEQPDGQPDDQQRDADGGD
jgi:hypothetical protein